MKIPDDIPGPLFQKLRYKKDEDGFGDKTWVEWFRFVTRSIPLDRTMGNVVADATRDNLSRLWMQNAAKNMPEILGGNKLWQLPKLATPALIVGAGPSVYAKKHLELLSNWIQEDFHRRSLVTIFATDRMLLPLVRQRIIPDYVVSVDGNAEKIAKFYEDPLIKGMGGWPKAILAITVSPSVAEACKKNSIPVYWFVAMLDDFTITNNITRLMHFMTDCTAVNCGGNAGSSAWAVANYLQAKTIALIGLDYGYLKGTPIEQTAYYESLKNSAKNPNEIFSLYFDHHNPDFNEDCYSDIMFNHYREGFLGMVELAALARPMETINCTEGGILHGSYITGRRFADWLKELDNAALKKN